MQCPLVTRMLATCKATTIVRGNIQIMSKIWVSITT